MPIRVAHVHLAHAPWHVGRRPRDFESLSQAPLVERVHVIHYDHHPRALVGGFVAFRAEGHLDGALATPALTVLAEEDLVFAGADSTEVRRIAPVPCFSSTRASRTTQSSLEYWRRSRSGSVVWPAWPQYLCWRGCAVQGSGYQKAEGRRQKA